MAPKLKFSEKIGYALGDTGGQLTFALISSYLTMFYTDVLKLPALAITVLMLVARIWDAVNDPLWGGLIDSRRPTAHGRFRPYIFGSSFPLAISAVFLFTKIGGLSPAGYIVYAYVTYIIYGMMYTGANIPYGALAAAVTDDANDRSSLSMIRSVGAGLGGLPASVLLTFLVYSTSENGSKVLDADKLFYCVLVLAVLSVPVYFAHFKLTHEHVSLPTVQKTRDYSFRKSAAALLKNRAFVAVGLASMFLIAAQMYTQTIFGYLFKDYFGNPALGSLVMVCTYLPMAVFILPMNRLIARFGKKELCAFGMGISAVVGFIAYLIGFSSLSRSPAVFFVILFFSGAGQTFFSLEVWALVMDVTDYHELQTGRKEEGTVYSVYNFIRKIGHTIAGAAPSLALSLIGYDGKAAEAGLGQLPSVSAKFWMLSTLVPAVMYLAIFVCLQLFYPLTKEKTAEIREAMQKK